MSKTLTEVTEAARLGEPLTNDELRFAVCAYDVLIAQFKVERYVDQLQEFFVAGEAVPEEYLTPANHPDNPDFVTWYRTFLNLEVEPNASEKP